MVAETVLVLGAVLLASATWWPLPARRPVVVGALGVVILGAAMTVLSGATRWQQLPVAVAVPVAVGLALLRMRSVPDRPTARSRVLRLAAVLTTAGCLSLAALSAVSSWAFPAVVLPEPGGRFLVGTTVLEWTDPLRPETATDRPDDRRTLVAQIWYPAAAAGDGDRARYLCRTAAEARDTARGLADLFGVPAFLLDDAARARTTSTADAPAAAGRFPVVVFSPGLGGVRMQNTALAQEVASHGYVVAALDHPYDSAVVVLRDGSVVRSTLTSTGDDDTDNAVANAEAGVRAADMRDTLTRLEQEDRGTGVLRGRLDTGRAVAAGHSIGGAAAVRAADEDPRFDAVLEIDGFPRYLPGASFDRPVLVLVAGRGTGDAGNDREYADRVEELLRRSGPGSFRLTVSGAAHLSFTDAPILLPPVPSLVGSLGRQGGHRATTGATMEFLEATVGRGDRDPSAGLARFGDLVAYD